MSSGDDRHDDEPEAATTTPPRHNYAAEHTPIASAKRPKTRVAGRPSLPDAAALSASPLTPMRDIKGVPRDSHRASATDGNAAKNDDGESQPSADTEAAGDDESPSSSWVGRKVDAIFSPVLNFLSAATGDGGNTNDLEDKPGPEESEETGYPRRNDNDEGVPTLQSTESSACHVVDGDGDVTMGNYRARHDANTNSYVTPVEASEEDERHVGAADGDDDDDDEEEDFNPYLFIKCLPPYQLAIPPGWASQPKALPSRDAAALPSAVPPICLVLDLDETLVHCTVEPVANADMTFPVEFNGTEYQVHVRCRPFLREFLEAVSQKFEVVIFTASQRVYADKLLDKIDPLGKFIRHRMFRDSCLPVEGNFLKDLTVLGREFSKMVLVDNSPHAFGYQVDNGIPIESWFDDPDDRELLKLEVFLRTLHGVNDVRVAVRETFQTHRLVLSA